MEEPAVRAKEVGGAPLKEVVQHAVAVMVTATGTRDMWHDPVAHVQDAECVPRPPAAGAHHPGPSTRLIAHANVEVPGVGAQRGPTGVQAVSPGAAGELARGPQAPRRHVDDPDPSTRGMHSLHSVSRSGHITEGCAAKQQLSWGMGRDGHRRYDARLARPSSCHAVSRLPVKPGFFRRFRPFSPFLSRVLLDEARRSARHNLLSISGLCHAIARLDHRAAMV